MPSLEPERDDADEPGQPIRIAKFLAAAGIGSRRHCEEYVTGGRVSVDGKVVIEPGTRVDPERQDVRLDGERIRAERKVYYVLNKPTGVLCTNFDPAGRLRVIDLFPKSHERLFTVGRLDENSEGLLVVTNDGQLAQRLAHPKFRVPKIYRVQVAGVPTRETLEQLTRGMYFPEGKFKAAEARLVKVHGQSAVVEIVLMEGQNREIRRLLAKVGHKVMRLTRVALGPLRLESLPSGEYRHLNAGEVRELYGLVRDAGGRQRDKRGRPGERRNRRSGNRGKRRERPGASRSRHGKPKGKGKRR